MENGQAFSRLMEEYGSLEKQEEDGAAAEAKKKKAADAKELAASASPDRPLVKTTQALMQEEERLTGAVSWSVYTKYFNYAGGLLMFPLVLLWITLAQDAQGAYRFSYERAENLVLNGWHSWKHPLPGILDVGDHSGVHTIGLHGDVRRARRCERHLLVYTQFDYQVGLNCELLLEVL